MPDWLKKFGDMAMGGLQTASDAASGARYLLAPNELEQSGQELDKFRPDWNTGPQVVPESASARSFERVKAGQGSLNDVLDRTYSQSRAQLAAERHAKEGPKIGPRPATLQIRDALEYIRPLPLLGSAADMLGMDTDATAQRDPYNNDDWADMPDPTMGITRIGVGADAATRRALRENLNAANAQRAKSALGEAASAAWDRFAGRYPRLSAHLSPAGFDNDALARVAQEAGGTVADVRGGFAYKPQGAKIGDVQLNPLLDDAAAYESLAHEGTHGARALRATDRGLDWKERYDIEMGARRQFLDPVESYLGHREEVAARRGAESAVSKDAIRQLEKLAGVR